MRTKLLEIRDANTFIPVVAIQCSPDCEAERYLLARCGYGGGPEEQSRFVLVARLSAEDDLHYDPNRWDGDTRTMPTAHRYIIEHFDEFRCGDVVDVEHILGERPNPKQPERLGRY